MVTEKVVVNSPAGLHIKPASKLCNFALTFQSKITFKKGNTEANAKSMLSVLAAGVKFGDELEITCEGPDEEEALAKIVEGLANNLDFS